MIRILCLLSPFPSESEPQNGDQTAAAAEEESKGRSRRRRNGPTEEGRVIAKAGNEADRERNV